VNDTPIPKSCFCPWEFLLMSHGGGSLGCIMCFPCKSFLSVIAIRGSDNPSPRALCRPPQDLIPPNIFHLPSSCRCSCHLMAEWKLPEADSGACIGCPHKPTWIWELRDPLDRSKCFVWSWGFSLTSFEFSPFSGNPPVIVLVVCSSRVSEVVSSRLVVLVTVLG